MKCKILIFFILILSACDKVNYYEDVPVSAVPTITLAHRGGGNDTLRENTLESCVAALSITEGLEVDVQISKDRTVWLSHSPSVQACENRLKCFAETSDKDIEAITTCNGSDISYTKLEEVFSYMQQNNIRKYISVDLKGWTPCSGNSLNIEAIMRVTVEEVIKLGEKYDLAPYLLFETQIPTVLKWAKKKNKSVSVYITSFGDYEKGMLLALKHKMDGISFKSNFHDGLDAESISLLHKKGLKMMVWNIADSSHASYFKSINVDFIQVDL